MVPFVFLCLAVGSLAAWLLLLTARGGFWRADQRLDEAEGTTPRPGGWPRVAAVIPARNEAATIARAVGSLLGQDYPGSLTVVVVDDQSDDGTAARARAAATGGTTTGAGRLTVVAGKPLPPGWTGKMWALAQGVDCARTTTGEPQFILLTDADIEHAQDAVRRLVDKAEREGLALVSLMVMLHGRGWWERLLVPAFVFFFQKLYPFRWVNDPRRREAAAAGGCMLVRSDALDAVGGIASVRDRLIDDCALAARIKPHGRVWLGLATTSRSIRPYDGLSGLWAMVTRTAFTQLRHSALALIGTVLGMVLVYLGPPVASLYGVVAATMAAPGWPVAAAMATAAMGIAAWAMMAAAWRPTLRLYGSPWWWGVLLPLAGTLFTLMTLDSARLHWQGHGGAWKGRTYGAARSGTA